MRSRRILAAVLLSSILPAAAVPLFEHVVRDVPITTRIELGASTQSKSEYIRHERHEQRHTDGWRIAERAVPDALLPMRIGLQQRNLQRGHDLLMNM
jgi:hypothetical protein